MIANCISEIPLNPEGDAYDLYSEFRARRDERAYQILNNVACYVSMGVAAGEYTEDIANAVIFDCVVAQLAIDVARQTEGI